MGFMLNVDDSIKLGVDTIQTVDFAIDTPKDSDARTTDVSVTMTITGKVLTMVDDGTEGTVDLALWSMISAETADCYKKVTVSRPGRKRVFITECIRSRLQRNIW